MMLTLTWWTIILTCHYLIKGLKSDGRTSTRFDVSQPINLRPSDWIFYPQSTFSSVWILSSVLINTQIDQLEHINIWQGRPKTYFTYKWWPGTHIYINVTHWRNNRDLICNVYNFMLQNLSNFTQSLFIFAKLWIFRFYSSFWILSCFPFIFISILLREWTACCV